MHLTALALLPEWFCFFLVLMCWFCHSLQEKKDKKVLPGCNLLKLLKESDFGHCVLATGTAQLLQHDTKGYPSSCCTSAHTLADVRRPMNLKQTAMAVDELS